MRKIRTRIQFEFDPLEMLGSDDPENIVMSEEEQLRYAANCFVDDIYNMVKYNELFEVALNNTEFVDEEPATALSGK